MTAADVKDALRGRHHAAGGSGTMVGEWTCLEELWGIDLLAWSAWGSSKRIGYEVKISRSDYRRELLRPKKRVRAVALCDQFYFAVPDGLLTRDELAYREPGDLRPGDFKRVPCPGADMGGPPLEHAIRLFGHGQAPPRYGGQCVRHRKQRQNMIEVPVPAVLPAMELITERERVKGEVDEWRLASALEQHGRELIRCPTCGGKGYTAKSRVEDEAPTLWVPADVGLVTVKAGGGGVRTVRKAPRNPSPAGLSPYDVAQAIRWASVRPDPRHAHDALVPSAA